MGYTDQRSFALTLGVTGGLVGQWETGAKVPGRANLRRIAQICGVSIDYLLGNAPAPWEMRQAVEMRAELDEDCEPAES